MQGGFHEASERRKSARGKTFRLGLHDSLWYLLDAHQQFGLRVFKQMTVENRTNRNLFLSPFAATAMLSLLCNGAHDETRGRIRRVLGQREIGIGEVNRLSHQLMVYLEQPQEQIVFDMANSLWVNRIETPLNVAFLNVCQNHYDTELKAIDFSLPDAADIINNWALRSTNSRIKSATENIEAPHPALLMISAVYLECILGNGFDPNLTEEGVFTRADGARVPCPFMSQAGNISYYEDENIQIADLPFGDGGYCLTVILPRETEDLDSLVANLDLNLLQLWQRSMSRARVDLSLPRLRLESDHDVGRSLRNLGLDLPFDSEEANLEGIARTYPGANLHVSSFRHRVKFALDERGNANPSGGVTSPAPAMGGYRMNQKRIIMRLDRPFLASIRETRTDAVVFIGRIADPVAR